MTTRAIRGAITIDRDEREHLHERTRELVAAIMRENDLTTDDVISVIFTCTPDIVSDFPAAAAREMGFGAVPLMCAQEMPVPGALPLVVRLMMHAETDRARDRIVHVYLRGAVALRRDLAQ
ncbi:chorismate mutase [Demequina lignilytica]|uniref:chorismate mutase n=1 Tax=Demequina lignilytica TaxID=3051663 RepID=A0AAW7M4F8_9MICO|nr:MULTISPECIES: chorismate mutase [unclassified Demequina]MDN4484478.1 chorismate mutase [Demequina sp. SYSU T0a273]MDN4486556.1 chorismate mutase [Demequina sp. SYSU T00039]MDN4489219.1 chorismate mutase [Demequina sp. SYSU T00068]